MSTAETHREIISIIGQEYFTPIAHLIDKWVDSRPVRRDSVGAPFFEGGYAVSVIILLVAAVESFVARDRYFSKRQPYGNHAAVPEYMKEMYRYRGYKRLSELFVVRDAVIHSHVWALKFAIRKSGSRRFVSASRISWSGNNRLKSRLNPKTYRTKLLRFNTIPSRIDRTDVIKAFGIVLAAIRFLTTSGAYPVPVFPFRVQHQGERMSFEELPNCLAKLLPPSTGRE
ncbi:MAG TPA: hypothetical protein PKN47_04315 [Nitrospira sp.]|nr:hypothetical protein [Nitrospira sp.]HNP80667.1 hypothetical protein [Nitrospira sp.]HRB15586.1 hypothetical protein [Nitrospira sp.]